MRWLPLDAPRTGPRRPAQRHRPRRPQSREVIPTRRLEAPTGYLPRSSPATKSRHDRNAAPRHTAHAPSHHESAHDRRPPAPAPSSARRTAPRTRSPCRARSASLPCTRTPRPPLHAGSLDAALTLTLTLTLPTLPTACAAAGPAAITDDGQAATTPHPVPPREHQNTLRTCTTAPWPRHRNRRLRSQWPKQIHQRNGQRAARHRPRPTPTGPPPDHARHRSEPRPGRRCTAPGNSSS